MDLRKRRAVLSLLPSGACSLAAGPDSRARKDAEREAGGDGSRTMRVRSLVGADPHSDTLVEWRYSVHFEGLLQGTKGRGGAEASVGTDQLERDD